MTFFCKKMNKKKKKKKVLDNLHKISKPVFLGKNKKIYFNLSFAENFTLHAKR